MSFTKESSTKRAKTDLADRLDIGESEIVEKDVVDKEFPDSALGAPADGEMSAQMISSGWQIKLAAKGHKYEYRADKYQLRLVGYKGKNYVVS